VDTDGVVSVCGVNKVSAPITLNEVVGVILWLDMSCQVFSSTIQHHIPDIFILRKYCAFAHFWNKNNRPDLQQSAPFRWCITFRQTYCYNGDIDVVLDSTKWQIDNWV